MSAAVSDRRLSRKLPTASDSAQTSAASMRFGAFKPGSMVLVSLSAAGHVVAGSSTIDATTARPLLAAGTYAFELPTALTHVAVIAATGSITASAWQAE